jgi:hypothetical protein
MQPHCSAMPWMPGIADFTAIPNMGVVLLSCITMIERMFDCATLIWTLAGESWPHLEAI